MSSAIKHITHLDAFDKVFKKRFESFDLSSILMYMIDTSPPESLFYLAQQFDVLGYKGWILAETDTAKRSLIKRAIELHRLKGTVYSVKEVIRAVGFPNPEVIEGVGVDYDGDRIHDGSITYAGGNWATFRVKMTVPNDREMNAQNITDLYRFIGEYKNARSHLLDLSFKVYFSDKIEYSEFIDLGEGVGDQIMDGIYYNGVGTYSGSSNHNKGTESINLRIINVVNNQIINDEF